MFEFQAIVGYIVCFFALYVQVFFLVALFQSRRKIIDGTKFPAEVNWPAITIIVPCWNEEDTVVETVESLLQVDYPKDKLIIKVIDDGSTDKTWERAQVFKNTPGVDLMTKPNGGKHTAMNYAITRATTEYVGNLDADTFLEKDALKKTMWQFLCDADMMAVSPAVVIHNPKGLLEKAQEVEFNIFILIKMIMAPLNGIHVTQGQFSMYRKKVFDDLGLYRKAHQTEDLEIAYRMHANGYKIGQCHDALVYTVAMDTLGTLVQQRLRWMYGFINNTYDYRKYIFNPKYGTFAFFSVPAGMLYIATTLFSTGIILWTLGSALYHLIVRLFATNFHPGSLSGAFFIDTRPLMFISLALLAIFVLMALIGKKARGQKPIPGMSLVYFFILFSFIGSWWLLRAFYNTLISRREVAWR